MSFSSAFVSDQSSSSCWDSFGIPSVLSQHFHSGMPFNTFNNFFEGWINLELLRVPGVLQRFSITYFVVATTGLVFMPSEEDDKKDVNNIPFRVNFLKRAHPSLKFHAELFIMLKNEKKDLPRHQTTAKISRYTRFFAKKQTTC